MFDALRRDNWLHNFAPDQRLAQEIGRACRDAFYPDEPAWKRQVFGHAQRRGRQARWRPFEPGRGWAIARPLGRHAAGGKPLSTFPTRLGTRSSAG